MKIDKKDFIHNLVSNLGIALHKKLLYGDKVSGASEIDRGFYMISNLKKFSERSQCYLTDFEIGRRQTSVTVSSCHPIPACSIRISRNHEIIKLYVYQHMIKR